MADGEAKLDFSGDASKAQAAIDKMTRALAKMREETRQANEEFKKGAAASGKGLDSWSAGIQKLKQQMDPWARGMQRLQEQTRSQKKSFGELTDSTEEFGSSMTSLTGTMVGVGTVVALASRGYALWRQKTDELALSHDDLAHSLTKTLAEAGKLALAPKVEQFLKQTPGITPQQGIATLGGVMTSGETLTDERAMGVAGQLARLAPTGIDLGEAGKLAGDVADVVGTGVSHENVVDLTVGLKQQLREKVGLFSGPKFQKQIERLKMGGMSGQDALAHAVVSLQSEQGAEGLRLLTKDKLSKDEKKLKAEIFTPQALEEVKKQMAGFQTGDIAQQQLNALPTTPLTNVAVQKQIVDEAEGQATLANGPYAERERARKLIATKAYQKGVGSYLTAKLNETTNRLFDMNLLGNSDEGFRRQGVRGGQAQQELEYATKQGLIDKADADRMIAALEANRKALEENSAATAGNTTTTKKANPPKANVDGQNEARGNN